jgi:starch-binding outer membrane protein, SusD/RagB family
MIFFKKIKNTTWLLGLLLVSNGCDKYLDTVPDNRTEINTPEKISELLVAAYPSTNYQPFCEIMSDNVSDNYDNSTLSPIYTKPYFWDDVLQLDTDSPQAYWAACYQAIAAANQALESIEKLGGGNKLNPQKGEALVARAYSHFMLVNLFSKFYDEIGANREMGIPYVTETEKVVLKQYDRKTVAYTYEMIEKDLQAGIPLISDESYKVPAFHFTKNAAYAFATRYYLYKKNYDKVIEYANKIAGDGGFTLNMRDWTNNYSAKSFTLISSEYAQASEKSNLLLAETASYWGRFWAGQRYGLSSNLGRELYFGEQPGGGALAYSLFGSERGVYLPKFNELFVRVNPSANIGNGYVMTPLFTTEEVLFNRAEAYLMKGNLNACLADINTFLSLRIDAYNASQHSLTIQKNNTFHNTSNSSLALFNTLMYYRRLEFMHEGLRWFDILRFNIPVIHENQGGSSQTLEPNSKKRVLQIPQEAALSGIPLNPR